MPQDQREGIVCVPRCSANCSGEGLDLLCPTHPTCFEDQAKRVWPSVQHYLLAKRFAEDSLIEQLRMAPSTSELLDRYADHEEHLSVGWEDHEERHLRNGLSLLVSSHLDTTRALLGTEDSKITYKGSLPGEAERFVGYMLMDIRDSLLINEEDTTQNACSSSSCRGTNQHRRSRRKHSPFYHKDGTATFDMVSSSAVRVTIDAEDVIIPMSAIPSRAKTAAHVYQFKKKRGFDGSDVDDDFEESSEDEIDSDAEEYLVKERDFRWWQEEEEEPLYSEECAAMVAMGFVDSSAVLAALCHFDGDLQRAIDLLTSDARDV